MTYCECGCELEDSTGFCVFCDPCPVAVPNLPEDGEPREMLHPRSMYSHTPTVTVTSGGTDNFGVITSDPPTTFEDALDAALNEVRETMIRKQRDYGVGNIAKFGEYGVVVRLSDKIERLINLHNSGNEPSNESLDDTWTDVIGYGIIGKMLRADAWGLPLEENTDAFLAEGYRSVTND